MVLIPRKLAAMDSVIGLDCDSWIDTDPKRQIAS